MFSNVFNLLSKISFIILFLDSFENLKSLSNLFTLAAKVLIICLDFVWDNTVVSPLGILLNTASDCKKLEIEYFLEKSPLSILPNKVSKFSCIFNIVLTRFNILLNKLFNPFIVG